MITTNAENLGQCKSTFALTVEQILNFTWSINLVRKVKKFPSEFYKRLA